jgi:hypothetical protein
MGSRSRDIIRPSFANNLRPPRGRRKDRVHAAPAVSCAKNACKSAHEHTGSAEAIRPSLRNGFTAYIALSPVIGLGCHRRPREALASQELDANLEASGPHDFVVRDRAARPHASSARRRSRVHRIPHQRFATIMIRPSWGHGTGGDKQVICGRSQDDFGKSENTAMS